MTPAFLHKVRKKKTFVIAFMMLFYTVGIIGSLYSHTSSLFITLTPFALLLSFSVLMVFHTDDITKRTVLLFGIIYILGYLIELIGVKTGAIFGSYIYNSGLGLKVLDTPILIGLNWLMLTYIFTSITNHLNISTWLKVAFASLGMVAYDVILEHAAPLLDMWHWQNNVIPFQNYMGWFLTSVLFQIIIRQNKAPMKNPLAVTILICQVLFFAGIVTYKYLFVV